MFHQYTSRAGSVLLPTFTRHHHYIDYDLTPPRKSQSPAPAPTQTSAHSSFKPTKDRITPSSTDFGQRWLTQNVCPHPHPSYILADGIHRCVRHEGRADRDWCCSHSAVIMMQIEWATLWCLTVLLYSTRERGSMHALFIVSATPPLRKHTTTYTNAFKRPR